MDAVDTANAAHQEALEDLDTALRQGGRNGTPVQRARADAAQAQADLTKAELYAARDTLAPLCHYSPAVPAAVEGGAREPAG